MARRTLVYLAAACAVIPASLRAQQFDSATTEVVAPGVVHRRLFVAAGPWHINVLEVSLRTPGITVRAARADDALRGREKVSEIARRHASDSVAVLAAINADFFNLRTGENENNQVVDGELWKGLAVTDAPADHQRHVHSQFAMTVDGRPLIERFALHAELLRAGSPPRPIDGVNVLGQGSHAALFTPRGLAGFPPDSLRTRVVMAADFLGRRGDTIDARVSDGAGGVDVDRPGIALVFADSAMRNALHPGDRLQLVIGLEPERGRMFTVIGGWPRLVVHGASVADSVDRVEGTSPSFSVTRHPRTGIGFSRDSTTLYLITVDGRQESSSGVSLAEFANLMLRLGVYEGLNLDGGGSTAMVINGVVVNHPSDPGGERTVGNALLVERTRP